MPLTTGVYGPAATASFWGLPATAVTAALVEEVVQAATTAVAIGTMLAVVTAAPFAATSAVEGEVVVLTKAVTVASVAASPVSVLSKLDTPSGVAGAFSADCELSSVLAMGEPEFEFELAKLTVIAVVGGGAPAPAVPVVKLPIVVGIALAAMLAAALTAAAAAAAAALVLPPRRRRSVVGVSPSAPALRRRPSVGE